MGTVAALSAADRFSSAPFVCLRPSSVLVDSQQHSFLWPNILESILGVDGDGPTSRKPGLRLKQAALVLPRATHVALYSQCSELEGTANCQCIAFDSNRVPPPLHVESDWSYPVYNYERSAPKGLDSELSRPRLIRLVCTSFQVMYRHCTKFWIDV